MTATAYELGLIITFISLTLAEVFDILNTSYLFADVSLLDVFVAILAFEIIVGFILRVLNQPNEPDDSRPDDAEAYSGESIAGGEFHYPTR